MQIAYNVLIKFIKLFLKRLSDDEKLFLVNIKDVHREINMELIQIYTCFEMIRNSWRFELTCLLLLVLFELNVFR